MHLINTLRVFYHIRVTVEFKWTLIVPCTALRLDRGWLFLCCYVLSFFSFLCSSISVCWPLVLRGAAASSRLHFTYTSLAVHCATHKQWLALFTPAWLVGLGVSMIVVKMGSFIWRFSLNTEFRKTPALAEWIISLECNQAWLHQV